MKLNAEEIKKRIESSFSPCSCVAEIWDYDRHIRFLITDKDGNEMYEKDSWHLGELAEEHDLDAAINSIRSLVMAKGIALD